MKNSTSNTAIPRILEKESQAQQFSLAKSHYENATLESKSLDSSFSSSLRGVAAVSLVIHKDKLESSIDCHAATSVAARNDEKIADSEKVDSSTSQTLNEPAKDSRIFESQTQKVSESQAEGFCDDFLKKLRFVGFQGVDEGIYLGDNEQAHAAESRKSAQNKRSGASVSSQVSLEKPTPKPNKAKSTKETKTPKPLICIPTYNEAKNIAPLLREIFSLFPKIHILIIDDNSTDGTQEILASLSTTYPNLHLLKRAGKLGLASAYIDGFLWGLKSGFSHFIQMDADFSHHPRYLAQTLANLPHFEVVINSRNIIGGGVVGWGLSRKILSRFGSVYARLWLGARVMDFTGGFNAYSARALRAINLHSIKSSGYCFQIEMKYRAYKAGLRLLELPIIFEDRIAGKSKMSKTIVLEALWRTPLLRLRATRAQR